MSESEVPLLPPHSVRKMRPRHRYRLSERFKSRDLIRLVLSASVVITFLLFFFTASIVDEVHYWVEEEPDFPDFSHYKFIQTLSDKHVPIHPHDDRRIIAIGDIHGMNQSLSALLSKISYDPQSDTLIHLGDLIPKRKKVSSEPILNFMAANRILGVRGNNDQKVVEWRAWREWILSLPGGREWLEDMDLNWSHIDGDESTAEIDAWLKKSHKKWKVYVPDGWKLQGAHYKVAQEITGEYYDYLRSLPLVLYAPTVHTYFVHAGLLAADPTRKMNDPKQPLSHFPTTTNPEDDDDLALRGLQELALLNEVPQNQDPWVLMNMRSLSKRGKVRDGKEGTPWPDLWNEVMGSCTGMPETELHKKLAKHGSASRTLLECFPSMVLYGHAAARDLDVNRWSVGLDTGCTYGRRLTAVVLDANSLFTQIRSEDTSASSQDSVIPYGDGGTARIVSVKCHK